MEKLKVCAKLKPASMATTPNNVAKGTTMTIKGKTSTTPAQKADFSKERVMRSAFRRIGLG
jgi:hypothetical protein